MTATAGPRPGLRSLLTQPAYRRLWTARTVSQVGDVAQFTTLAGIKADKKAMIAKITAGAMPKGNPTWKTTADGKTVLKWLKTGADLK